MNVIITVVGAGKPGIVAMVSGCLFEHNVNILDISQTVMREGIFTMSLLADCEKMNCAFPEFKGAMDKVAQKLSMDIRVQREEIFASMHRI